MRFDEGADLDTSQVNDLRGAGGGGSGGLGGRVAIGGGGLGVVGLIIFFLISALGGGTGGVSLPSGSLGSLPSGQQTSSTDLSQTCRTGADANNNRDCEIVAFINSIQSYWTDQFARSGQTYRPVKTNFFNGSVNTGCGAATSDVGPFYCPADQQVYIDLAFFDELDQRFGTQGGPFARAYVLAHEYGHHVQNLLGTSNRVSAGSGPTSGSVRLELQADCYAGVWGNHATTTPGSSGRPLITDISQQDIAAALDTAGKIGDDYIQTKLGGGRADPSQFTHGTSAQRQKWFNTGIQGGDPSRCDTFATNVNLG